MKWLLLLAILIVALLIFALYRRVQPGSNTYQGTHPVAADADPPAPTAGQAPPAAGRSAPESAAPPAAEAAPAAEEGWAETPPTDEQSTEVPNAESLASSRTPESEIAEPEGERQAPDEPRG